MIISTELDKIYNPFENMNFSYDNCFLCGEKLNKNNYSVEHIYPQWLQKKFKLENQNITLLNNTLIKYKNLTVPCCKECNNILNKNIEKPFLDAILGGYDEFIKLDRDIIFKWLNKLAYGMLFKELSLKADIKNPLSENIIETEDLKERRMEFIFLQSSRYKTEYVKKPYSLLVFRLKEYEYFPYWVMDPYDTHSFFMRLNDIGIVANLQDNGAQEEHFMGNTELSYILNKKLSLIQFAEICANVYYQAKLNLNIPCYKVVYNQQDESRMILSLPMPIYYDNWDMKIYSKILQYIIQECCGVECEDLYFPDKKAVCTFLFNEDGNFKELCDKDFL